MKRLRIGLLLETRQDAEALGCDLGHVYHWREPEEIEAIRDAVSRAGCEPVTIGTPEQLAAKPGLRHGIDFVFNLSVGFLTRYRLARGPALCSLLNLPYSGADPYTKMVSQNKPLMKALWAKLNIPTPAWAWIPHPKQWPESMDLEYPVIVKPSHEGSSVGIYPDSLAANEAQLRRAAHRLWDELHMPMIAEEFIAGREYKVGILGNEEIAFSGVIEDTCDKAALGSAFLDFEAKTAGRYGKRACDPADPLRSRILHDSLAIYRQFLPVDYGTLDVKVDGNGRHYFLEFNADATLHPQRTLAQCCGLHGMAYPKMIQTILEIALRRWQVKP